MKTITHLKMAVLLCTLAVTAPVFANNTNHETTTHTTPTAEEKAKAEVLLKRLDEIKAMDKSELTRAERKALRKEVKEIKATLKSTGQGVYLSVGAIIIIILLLILLL